MSASRLALRVLVTLTLACLLGSAGSARAETNEPTGPASELEPAREAFVLGLALSRAEQWPDALAAFERSASLKPHPVTTYNIAYCERSLGRHASAYRHFSLALAAGEPDQLPASFADQARAYLAEAEQRVAHAHVRLASPSSALQVDGRPITALRVRSEPDRTVYVLGDAGDAASAVLPTAFELWLDPGRRLFALTRPGQPQRLQTHEIGPGATIELVLGAAPAAPPAKAPRPNPAPRAFQPPDRRLALGIVGLGVAGFVASAAFSVTALDYKHQLDNEKCPNRVCPEDYYATEDAMKLFANAATAGLIVGVLGVGAGGYLYFSAKPRATGLQVWPRLGLASLGAEGSF